MFWNYRIVKRENPSGKISFSIHEAYYDENGNVGTITTEPAQPHGENLEELKKDLECYCKALNRLVLDYSHFPTTKFSEGIERLKSEKMVSLEEALSEIERNFEEKE